ncbi:serine/arginine-rich splicing factor 4 isoform X2 [Oryzias latipes]|uniref:serine/arginine-rich splicing factor 4 isoform X2 n=1 Tax=Oryzias latipes TaxID=8090 RepID=UPI0000E9C41E|nr:serine/arginine-rich splicing factor 4 isoform X2 [Oryzias latipes]
MSRVYIGRLSYRAREKDVERFFKGYGKILEVDLKNGYGFVEFDDPRDADDAVYDLNGKELCGERVIVEHTKGPRRDGGYGGGGRSGYGRWGGRDRYGPPVRTDYRLIVENLSSRCSWQDLKDYMRQAGEVTYADTHKGRRNEGVIEFRQYSDMKRALEKLDGTEVNGRKIRLIEDRPGAKRRRSYSRSHSRSRSRSRSRRSHKSRSRSESSSRSRSRSRAASRSRSRSQSKKSKGKKEDEERSNGAQKGEEQSRSPKSKKGKKDGKKSKKGSRSRSRSASRSRSRSRSGLKDSSRKSVSKGPDPPKSDDEAGEPERGSRSRSRSRSPDEPRARSKSKSKSQSPAGARSRSASRSESRSKSRSQSRSRSRSRS